MIHCLISFLFFFLERYTKRQERFCYFLMKTLRTLKYPVFIRVTNSNSKVHPFIDMMWWEPISARILGEWNVQFGEKPRGWGYHCLHFWVMWIGWVELTTFIWKTSPTGSQTLIQCHRGRGHLGGTVLRSAPGSEVARQGTGSLPARKNALLPPGRSSWHFPVKLNRRPVVIFTPSYNG